MLSRKKGCVKDRRMHVNEGRMEERKNNQGRRNGIKECIDVCVCIHVYIFIFTCIYVSGPRACMCTRADVHLRVSMQHEQRVRAASSYPHAQPPPLYVGRCDDRRDVEGSAIHTHYTCTCMHAR